MTTASQILQAFVLGFPTEAFCIQCLARKTGIAQHEIRIAARDLVAAGGIRSRRGQCTRCARPLTVLCAPASAIPEVPDADVAAG